MMLGRERPSGSSGRPDVLLVALVVVAAAAIAVVLLIWQGS